VVVVSDPMVFAGGSFTAVGALPQSAFVGIRDAVTGVADRSEGRASAIFLHVGPNPFATSTDIYFQLARRQPVTLRIYDVSGRAVRTLRERDFEGPGLQRMRFDRRGLPSGLYFARLEADGSSVAGKIVLLR
jgi:hypothetical protein